jgi:hypothetical protein
MSHRSTGRSTLEGRDEELGSRRVILLCGGEGVEGRPAEVSFELGVLMTWSCRVSLLCIKKCARGMHAKPFLSDGPAKVLPASSSWNLIELPWHRSSRSHDCTLIFNLKRGPGVSRFINRCFLLQPILVF